MANYSITNNELYHENYKQASNNPKQFWGELAKENFLWKKPWDSVLDFDFSIPKISWFDGAQLNITENCIDRHLKTNANKTAIIFEPNDSNSSSEHISYKDLHERVNKFANVLKSRGIKKGDRVYVEGRIKTRKWQGDDGKDRYSTEIHVDDFTFLTQRPTDAAATPAQQTQQQPAQPTQPASNDDLPF